MFYQRLKIIRKQNGLSQQQIADLLGVSRSTYCSYEIGRRSVDIDTIIRLSKFYRLSLDMFIGDFSADSLSDNDDYEAQVEERFLSQLSNDERNLIAKYRALSLEKKEEITKIISEKNKQ